MPPQWRKSRKARSLPKRAIPSPHGDLLPVKVPVKTPFKVVPKCLPAALTENVPQDLLRECLPAVSKADVPVLVVLADKVGKADRADRA